MTKQEIEVLKNACQMAGIDAKTIRPEKPFKKKGKVAGLLQVAVSEISPAQAAKWRVDAGGSLSVATLSEMHSGGELSQAAQQDLWHHDASYVVDRQKEDERDYQSKIQHMEKESAEARMRLTLLRTKGDANEARRVIAAEDAANQQRAEQQAVWAQGGMV